MTFTDSPDWQEVSVTVSQAGAMPDAPDWQRTVVAPGGGGIGGVSSWNGRTGAVTLEGADVEALFAAAGELLVGTGNGTAEFLAKGAAGQVLTVGGSDASGLEWATPSGGNAIKAGSLGGNVTYSSGQSGYPFEIGSLPAGQWLVLAIVNGNNSSAASSPIFTAQLGGGSSVTFGGGNAVMSISSAVNGEDFNLTMAHIVNAGATWAWYLNVSNLSANVTLYGPGSGGVPGTGYIMVKTG